MQSKNDIPSTEPVRNDRNGSKGQILVLVLMISCLVVTVAWVMTSSVQKTPMNAADSKIEIQKPAGPSLEEQVEDLLVRLAWDNQVPERPDFDYSIVKGDSLNAIAWKIKRKYDLTESPAEIRQGILVENDIVDLRRLQVGQKLRVPLSQFVRPKKLPAPDYRLSYLYDRYEFLDDRNIQNFLGQHVSSQYDPTPKTVLYTVRRGESLYTIARKIKERQHLAIPVVYLVQEICALNDIDDPKRVHPGTELEITLADRRTMTAMLSYEGYEKIGPVLKLYYTKSELEGYVAKALKRYQNIPPQTFKRMMAVESGGNHLAVSPVGAAGLMQIMPLTGKRLGMKVYNEKGYVFPADIGARGAKAFYRRYARELQTMAQDNPKKLMRLDDRFVPQKNIMASARYLSRLIAMYGQRAAVAVYNGGHRGLAKNKPRETQAYVRIVLR